MLGPWCLWSGQQQWVCDVPIFIAATATVILDCSCHFMSINMFNSASVFIFNCFTKKKKAVSLLYWRLKPCECHFSQFYFTATGRYLTIQMAFPWPHFVGMNCILRSQTGLQVVCRKQLVLLLAVHLKPSLLPLSLTVLSSLQCFSNNIFFLSVGLGILLSALRSI